VEHITEAFRQLREDGLLLVQDPLFPSITTIVAGGPIRGSWLGNPSAHGIYDVLVALEESPDVLVTKLVSGKVTFVHRDLWPALVSVAISRSEWQLRALSESATWLLGQVDADGRLQSDLIVPPANSQRKAIADAARELERRLLIHSTEVHTPSGAHAKVLQTWSTWISESSLRGLRLPSESAARRSLEQAVEHLNREYGAAATLPWLQLPPRPARRHSQ
jgi:hypothetical protein